MVFSSIHIINGPNLNLLGRREPKIYGTQTFEAFFKSLQEKFSAIELSYFQSNHEGFIIDKLHEIGFDPVGIVINPGGLTHTSVSLGDAVAAIEAPVVEVHISNIYARESFRHYSYIKPYCKHSVVGKGLQGYKEAIEHLSQIK